MDDAEQGQAFGLHLFAEKALFSKQFFDLDST